MDNYIMEEVRGELLDSARDVYRLAGGLPALVHLIESMPETPAGHRPSDNRAGAVARARAFLAQQSVKDPLVACALIALAAAFLAGIEEHALTGRTAPVIDPMAPTQCPECKHFGHHAESCTLHARFAEALRRGKA